MKSFITGIGCLLVLAVFGVSSNAAQSSLAGEWVGGYEINGNYVPVNARFKLEDSAVSAMLDLPLFEEAGVALGQVRFVSPKLHFELARRIGPLAFDGELNGDTILGTVEQGNARGTFHLVRSAG